MLTCSVIPTHHVDSLAAFAGVVDPNVFFNRAVLFNDGGERRRDLHRQFLEGFNVRAVATKRREAAIVYEAVGVVEQRHFVGRKNALGLALDHLIAGEDAIGIDAHAIVWIDTFDGTDLEEMIEAELRQAGLECEGNPGVAVGVDCLAGEPLQGGKIETTGEVGPLGPVGEPLFSGLVPDRVGRGGLGIDRDGVVGDLVDRVRGITAVERDAADVHSGKGERQNYCKSPRDNVSSLSAMKVLIDWCNANQGFVMAILTFVYVVATICLVLLVRGQLNHAVELEQGRTRPFVIFDLVTEHHFVFATLTNTGQTPARDVRLSISPQIKAIIGGQNAAPSEERLKEIAFLERGVAMMPPGRTIKALVGHWSHFRNRYSDLRFEGSISYNDQVLISYSEPVVVDLAAEEGLLFLARKDIDDVARNVEKISKTLDSIERLLKRQCEGGGSTSDAAND